MENHIRFDHAQSSLVMLDQRMLPHCEAYVVCRNSTEVVQAVQGMVVRGAPAIGVAAAWGAVLAAGELAAKGFSTPGHWENPLDALLDKLAKARPTAVNLAWAVERMRLLWKESGSVSLAGLLTLWKAKAALMQAEDITANQRMGILGATLLNDGDTVLTHCNAGALATAGYGTALGVIRAAWAQGKNIRVIADETRPLLQGARLTAYELQKEGIPVTVACDNACALLMKRGAVQKVVTGADRIAANGDTANKIGTYGVAVLARAHSIPFYVAAPLSTIDVTTATGEDIPLEERPRAEVACLGETVVVPDGVAVYNFAFDVTPAEWISGIITEQGVLCPPYDKSIRTAVSRNNKTAKTRFRPGAGGKNLCKKARA